MRKLPFYIDQVLATGTIGLTLVKYNIILKVHTSPSLSMNPMNCAPEKKVSSISPLGGLAIRYCKLRK